MRPLLRDHVIFVAMFVALSFGANPKGVKALHYEASGYGPTHRPNVDPLAKTTGCKALGTTDASKVPEALLVSRNIHYVIAANSCF